MADNLAITAGSGTTVATDEIGAVHYQRVKVTWGADGTANDANASTPLPITDAALVALSKAEDAAHSSGDQGIMALGVRKATPANLSGTDGDYEPLQVSAGRLWTGSLIGDGTNNVAVKAASTAPQATDPALVVAISPNGQNANGSALSANSAPVVPASDWIGSIGGLTARVSANFNRPADTTAYASGDLVANSTTAGSVTPMSWTAGRSASGYAASGMVRRARVQKSNTSLTNASFRLHLYSSSPTVTNGDNGAWLSTIAGYLGSLDVTMDKAFSDAAAGICSPAVGAEINFTGQTVYGLLEARAAYTPASGETFTVEIEILRN